MRVLAALILFFLLFVPLETNMTYSEKIGWFGPLKYRVSAEIADPYNDSVVVSLELVDVNETALQNPFTVGFGALKYVIVTFDYYSKFFDFNMTELFKYGNGTYEAYNYTFRLYFPIFSKGNCTLNVTVVVWMVVFIVSVEIPVSLVLSANVPYSRVPVNLSLPGQQLYPSPYESIVYWLYGLTALVLGELGVIIYLIKRGRS